MTAILPCEYILGESFFPPQANKDISKNVGPGQLAQLKQRYGTFYKGDKISLLEYIKHAKLKQRFLGEKKAVD